MFDKAVIHLGAHKTGTTHLQQWLQINRAELLENDIAVPSRSILQPFSKAAVARIKRDQDAEIPKLFGDMVLKAGAKRLKASKLILSDEDLLGLPNLARTKTFYPHAGRIVSALATSIPCRQRLWLFTIRDIAAFVQSTYIQQLKMGSYLKIEKYLARFDAESLDWDKPVSSIIEAMPADDRLVVCVYDGRRTNPKLHKSIEDFLGPTPLPAEPEGLSNAGYNAKGIALARAANRALEEMRDRRLVRKFIQENFSLGEGEAPPKLLPLALEEKLRDVTVKSIEAVRKRQGDRMIVI